MAALMYTGVVLMLGAGSIPQQGRESFSAPHQELSVGSGKQVTVWHTAKRVAERSRTRCVFSLELKHTPPPPPLLKQTSTAFFDLGVATSCSLTEVSSSAPTSQSLNGFKITVSPGGEPSG